MMPDYEAPTVARSKLVVLAEDDAALRSLLAFALEMDGYCVVSVATGRALVEQVHRILTEGELGGLLDLVISDVRMPDMDGLSALEHLRHLEVRVPVILITAFVDRWTRTAAAQFGAELLDKPVELRKLRAVVRARLGGLEQ